MERIDLILTLGSFEARKIALLHSGEGDEPSVGDFMAIDPEDVSQYPPVDGIARWVIKPKAVLQLPCGCN